MAGSAPGQHARGPSFPIITHPEQLLNLSEADRAAFLEEDAKRAKRNHKIAQLAKDNGLMTPQDKNFITRIQLQQLMTATGNIDERGPEAAIAEDGLRWSPIDISDLYAVEVDFAEDLERANLFV